MDPYKSPKASLQNALLDGEIDQQGRGMVKVSQIITIGLVTGLAIFALFVQSVAKFAVKFEPTKLGLFGAGFFVVLFILQIVIPAFHHRQIVGRLPKDTLDKPYAEQFKTIFVGKQTGHIIACALMEAPGFLNLIAYQRSQWFVNLILAGLSLAVILFRFPTVGRAKAFVRHQLEELSMRRA